MSSLDGRGEGGGEGRYRETEEGKCCHRVGGLGGWEGEG